MRGHGGGRTSQRAALHNGMSVSESDMRDESYLLLLELITQEPTIQNCFKIIESTCLAQGIDVTMDGNPATKEFKTFIEKYYVSFCENAIRCFFACGFVPWRLRKIASGDPVPEVIPFGLYSWTVENNTNHPLTSSKSGNSRSGSINDKQRQIGYGVDVDGDLQKKKEQEKKPDHYTRMAQVHFQKQKTYFGSGSFQPYQLQGDLGTMKGNAKAKDDGSEPDPKRRKAIEREEEHNPKSVVPKRSVVQSAAYERQRRALERQPNVADDYDSKLLHYKIHFNRSCRCIEDEVEIYEYLQPSMDVTTNSILYRTVPSPMSHLLIDYRNLRHAMIRKEYADNWNTQSKMICSYTSQKNIYQVSEGNPIVNDWNTQNRLGMANDYNLPMEMDQNAYTRDAITETIAGQKDEVHKPVVYTLPKNSKLENVPHLESIQDTDKMETKLAKDIASIMGIPYEIIGGGYGDKQGKKKSLENSRIFTTNMVNICRHLEHLLKDVYTASYGSMQHEVKFTLRATPRIEINNVEEVCMLLEAGVVSFNDAMTISNMLLGVDLQQGAGQQASAGQFNRTFVTPNHKKDLIVAANAQKKAQQSSSGKK
uniref:Uncharacterized protein n=2 Tax=Hemiselmis andersenii TaxID=464988 RepID=A0A6T8KLY8_HEMAN|mmetsp:Transcript_25824/g.59833  ORF Transcript_25824/g.59833 Transcript_25824/m.59833 type:complete len:594 (+) Transcript_25824:862-2643(+)